MLTGPTHHRRAPAAPPPSERRGRGPRVSRPQPRKSWLKKALRISALVLALPGGAQAGAEQQRALFLQAEQALSQGRVAEARQDYEALADYPLKPYLGSKILSEAPGIEADIPAFLQRYGTTRYADALRGKWLAYLAQREAWADYVRDYRDTSDVRLQCGYYWSLHRAGREAEAYAGAAKLWDSGDAQPASCDRLFAAWQASPGFSPDHLWKRLGLALAKNQASLAERLREQVPASDRGTADFWFAVHANPNLVEQCGPWQRGQPLHGRIFAHGIDRLAGRDPLWALSLWNLRQADFAIDKDSRARVEKRLALELATQRYPQAEAYLGSLGEAQADSQIRAWRVRAALLKQYWPGVLLALESFDAAERRQPIWQYWRARALEALGETAAALEIYRELAKEREFYGFVAADRLRLRYPLSFTPTPIPETELQRLADSEPFRAVQEFRLLNRPGEAQKEWMHAIKALPQADLAVAAKLAQQWGWDRLAILTMSKADNRDDLTLRFPTSYAEPVQREAQQRQLDPALVYGLIRRESAFDPGAKSSSGALGLMQIMPATGQEMARALNEAWQSERALLDPQTNLRYGTAYFRWLLDRYSGHLVLATTAYNAGPGRVERWLPVSRPLPADIWIESIPFNESRQYVGAVLAYAAIYRERLGEPPAPVSNFLTDIAPGGKGEPKPDRPRPVPVCP